jgi:hypothetical protein
MLAWLLHCAAHVQQGTRGGKDRGRRFSAAFANPPDFYRTRDRAAAALRLAAALHLSLPVFTTAYDQLLKQAPG